MEQYLALLALMRAARLFMAVLDFDDESINYNNVL
jgi:hypothetical protein